MDILVTGGAGFVGSNLSIRLKEALPDSRVWALDNLKRRGSELNLPRLKSAGVKFVHGDIRNPEDLELEGLTPDILIECSAEPSVLAGYDSSPAYVINTNLAGTINCLEAARKWKAGVIFLSTSRVYPVEKLNSLRFSEDESRFVLVDFQDFPGASSEGISREFPLGGFRSIYGATKLSSELLMEEYRAAYGIKAVINRCGCVTGPWQMGRVDQGVFVHWVGSHYFKKELAYFGYGGLGKQVRDVLHIDDLYRLIEAQISAIDSIDGCIFNIGGGRGVSLSLLETTRLCSEVTGNRLKIKGVEKDRQADIRIYISDLRDATGVTGWRPERSASDVVTDIFNWINSNEKLVRETLFS